MDANARKLTHQGGNGIRKDTRRITYENLRASYVLDYVSNQRKSLHCDKGGNVYFDCVKRLDDFFVGYRANQIDVDGVRRFQAEKQAKALSNGSINRSVSALRRLFNLALEDGKLESVRNLAPMYASALTAALMLLKLEGSARCGSCAVSSSISAR